jgi:trans-2,3-dihydro-3-hydroxyanthranilate isomerase
MRLTWVDVFATAPLTGNPLAVITDAVMPPPGRMQAIAAELGLSETVFATPGPVPEVRIFTPVAEIPLAGHPLVGAAWVLRHLGWIGDDAVIRAPGGDIPVHADDSGAQMTRTAPRAHGDADAPGIAAALGATATGPAPIWDAGLAQAMLPVDDLAALRPDHGRLRDLAARDGWVGVSAYRLEAAGRITQAEVRHFAAPIGIDEDPVTGSAAAALGCALFTAGRRTGSASAGLDLVIRQGHHMGRPGHVEVSVRRDAEGVLAVRVGGAVVPVITGTVGGRAVAG